MLLKDRNTPSCPICSNQMVHFASIPAAVHLPELLRFKCEGCSCFKTIESPDGPPEARKLKAA